MKKLLFYSLLVIFGLMLFGCETVATNQPVATVSVSQSAVPSPSPSETAMAFPTLTSTLNPTAIPTEVLPTSPPPSNTPQPEPTTRSTPQNGTGLIIDHQAVALFDQIPDEYIQAASEITWLHRHASVGTNIRFGLDCLYNYFPDRPDPNQRPYACDKNVPPADIVYGEKYDSSKWIFEPHAYPSPNPGWNNKTINFINRLNNLSPDESYQYASYNFGYVEDPTILKHFFSNTNPDDTFPSVFDLETLQAEHPDITFIWWTSALARQTPEHILEFNELLRAYAIENNKILLDIADIESHEPDGTPCTGVDANANPTQETAVCDDYADEVFAGHLNAQGSDRMAKAIWVMMAILAGWDGVSP